MKYELIVMGASLGGLRALQVVLGALPKTFPAVVIVQHRDKEADDTLTTLLMQHLALPVSEVEDKQPILPGQVYLAPPDYHLLIEDCRMQIDFGNALPQSAIRNPKSQISNLRSEICHHFALSTEAPVGYARPSIDVLFESAAEAYAEKAIGVILTGANQDGARGLAAIKARGGLAIVQDPATAEARAMPEAAIAATPVDQILPLEAIGPFLANLCHTGLSCHPEPCPCCHPGPFACCHPEGSEGSRFTAQGKPCTERSECVREGSQTRDSSGALHPQNDTMRGL